MVLGATLTSGDPTTVVIESEEKAFVQMSGGKNPAVGETFKIVAKQDGSKNLGPQYGGMTLKVYKAQ